MADSPRPAPLSLLRTLSLADGITLGNAAAGTLALFACLQYLDRGTPSLWVPFALLPVAFVLDALDGRVARWRHSASPLGQDLDSLADIISFGVAPAALGFTLGMREVTDIIVLVYFVVCGVARLARFNVTALALDDGKGKVRYFEGTPIPTSLFVVLLLAVAHGLGATGHALWLGTASIGPVTFHPMVLLFAASGTGMISARLRIPKP